MSFMIAGMVAALTLSLSDSHSAEPADNGQGDIVGYSEPQANRVSFSGNMAIFANNYHYKEVVNNANFVEHSGKFSGGGEFNWRMDYGILSLGTDLSFKVGKVRYSSASGVSPDETYQIIEPRAIVGIKTSFDDWNNNPITLNPYTGFGYRYYYNDARSPLYSGSKRPNIGGYRRETEYWYLPLGLSLDGEVMRLTPSTKTDQKHDTNEFWQNRITWKFNFEYDLLLSALNRSYLGDIYGCYSASSCPAGVSIADLTIDNRKDAGTGFGLKASLEFGYNNISFGPYYDYWEMSRYKGVSKDFSNYPELVNQTTGSTTFYEPANVTTEVGIRLRLGF